MTPTPLSTFEGKVALVTGGARNIGLATAQALAAQGAGIAVADICRDLATIPYPLSSPNDLDDGVKALQAAGARALGLRCDVRDEAQVHSMVQQVIGAFGRIDILVNNAGVISLACVGDLTEALWDEVIDVCLKGTFFCCKQVVPHMRRQRGGRIINISSLAGLRGLGNAVHYVAAKHGVIGLTKALAMELAGEHITVNAICPGTVESPMLSGLACQIDLESDAYEHFAKGHLLPEHRITPRDIAHTVRWLASDESRSITGAIVNVDAGWSARG